MNLPPKNDQAGSVRWGCWAVKRQAGSTGFVLCSDNNKPKCGITQSFLHHTGVNSKSALLQFKIQREERVKSAGPSSGKNFEGEETHDVGWQLRFPRVGEKVA